MCGLAGLITSSSASLDTRIVKAMTKSIRHRGPSDVGVETPHERVGFGFRRLSILDLSPAGHQPMYGRDRQTCLVFNGEIYNSEELKSLVGDYPFRSRTDTELLLALFDRFGLEMLPKLNGMFALAIWDGREKKVHLATDRFGIKPLYFTSADGDLIFGSEIKAIFSHPAVSRQIDNETVNDYLSFQFSFGERTFYEGVSSIEPGTVLTFGIENPTRVENRYNYWEMEFDLGNAHSTQRDLNSHAIELREALGKAIVSQTRSDVPVGSFLSGGMDTGSIATIASGTLGKIDTFTCGFDTSGVEGREKLNDERPEAQSLSEMIGSRHHEITVGSNDLQRYFDSVFWHLEDPRVGISYQIYQMAAEVKRHVTVVLSGTGGDELFGGYAWRYSNVMGVEDFEQFSSLYHSAWNRILSIQDKRDFLHPSRLAAIDLRGPERRFRETLIRAKDFDPLSRALYFDSKTFLRGLLQVDDKLTMAHSIESRVPLLDNNVVDVCLRTPSNFKFDGKNTKIVLKEAVRGLLPDEVINRRKQGFTPPDDHWFRTSNRSWIESRLLSEEFLDRQWLTRAGVKHILEDHYSGKRSARFAIWSLLCVDAAYRQFIDGKIDAEGVFS